MVDIAASLSLTSTGPALDPSAILGLETADMQAFGDILAGKVGAPGAAAATINPFAALTLAAGNRQPGGKILPDAPAALPDAAAAQAELHAAPVVAVPALVTTKLAASLARAADKAVKPEGAAATPEPAKQAEASPVHDLIKMFTAALKGQRPADEDASEAAPVDPEAATDETSEVAAPATIPATAIVQVQAALSLPLAVAANAGQAPRANSQAAHAAPRAAERAADQSAVKAAIQAGANPVQAATPQGAFQLATLPVASQPAAKDAAPAVTEPARPPVLTVTATEVPVAAVTLVAKPVLPGAARSVTAQVNVARADGEGVEAPAAGTAAPAPLAAIAAADPQAAERPAAALRGAVADRAALIERVMPEFTASPIVPLADASAQVAGSAAPAIPGAAPAIGAEPRQDFAALVERLVEARNAGAAQSTHASIQHAEFGQVSLKFQQDGGALSVSMSSADPDFAIAAQAAMPAERQNFNANADAQPRQNQGQQQANTGTSSNSQHEASAQRDAGGTEQQGRGNRNNRNANGNDSSNPSPRWSERDQPSSRGGIFA